MRRARGNGRVGTAATSSESGQPKPNDGTSRAVAAPPGAVGGAVAGATAGTVTLGPTVHVLARGHLVAHGLGDRGHEGT